MRFSVWIPLLALTCFVGCERHASAPTAVAMATPVEEPASPELQPVVLAEELRDGGPRVRMGRVVVPAGAELVVSANGCQEVYLKIVEGGLDQQGAGTVTRLQQDARLRAAEDTTLLAALVRHADSPFPNDVTLCGRSPAGRRMSTATEQGTPPLPFAGGKLRVQIFHDAHAGAELGALSLLDGDADLGVPEHVHEASAEVLFIESGDGTMILGEERFPLSVGRVVYVPPNTNHGYEAGTEPLRALQVYAPGGPEQRFRPSAPALGANSAMNTMETAP